MQKNYKNSFLVKKTIEYSYKNSFFEKSYVKKTVKKL